MATECTIRKSKAERQKWWAELSPIKKEAYLKKKQDQKAVSRRKRSIALMKSHKGEYNCGDCIHGLTGSCTDNLPNACEYWANPSLPKKGLLELNPKLHRKFNKMPSKTKNISFKAFRTKHRVEKNPAALDFKVPRHTYG